jgi:hypothetical protein
MLSSLVLSSDEIHLVIIHFDRIRFSNLYHLFSNQLDL